MNIIAHRGLWTTPEERNTMKAFQNAWKNGFGIETDIRDYMGELVISHDIADASCLLLCDFLKEYKNIGNGLLLAMNIKADGLQDKFIKLLLEYKIENYFLFDMSVPEQFVYLNKNLCVYTRNSPYELTPSFYDDCKGVWLDGLGTDWITKKTIEEHIYREKKIAIVSPELHGKDYTNLWNLISHYDMANIYICTDFPQKAAEVFYDKD